MVIVTGTKRSGTSMWMQILKAAGLPMVGAAFPGKWGDTIREANPNGFYESKFRRGIYYGTNPDPVSGLYLPARVTPNHAVKIFIPGVVRTERAYLRRVVVTVRHWQEYVSSLTRLYEMEQKSLKAKNPDHVPMRTMNPLLEWWLENFMLLRDVATRRYPIHMISYDAVVSDPSVVERVITWLGVGDAEAAAEAVKPDSRSQARSDLDPTTHRFSDVFDELYAYALSGAPIPGEFLEKLNATHLELCDEIEAEQREIIAANRKRGAKRKKKKPVDVAGPDIVEATIHRSGDTD